MLTIDFIIVLYPCIGLVLTCIMFFVHFKCNIAFDTGLPEDIIMRFWNGIAAWPIVFGNFLYCWINNIKTEDL